MFYPSQLNNWTLELKQNTRCFIDHPSTIIQLILNDLNHRSWSPVTLSKIKTKLSLKRLVFEIRSYCPNSGNLHLADIFQILPLKLCIWLFILSASQEQFEQCEYLNVSCYVKVFYFFSKANLRGGFRLCVYMCLLRVFRSVRMSTNVVE